MNAVELTPHPAALRFPALSEKEYAALKSDIQTSGQLHPVVINERNEILDGVHRVRACRELGLEPETVQLADVLGGKQVSEIEFIYSCNYHRRHLSDDQRLALNALFLPEMRRQAQEEKSKGIAEANARQSNPLQAQPVPRQKPRPRGVETKLANVSGVGHGKSRKAINLSRHAPELLDQVAAGEKKLATAYNEMMATRSAEAVATTDSEPIPPETLQLKVARFLDRFLASVAPGDHVQVLQIICDCCRSRMERLEKEMTGA
jgi:hypothetical protein